MEQNKIQLVGQMVENASNILRGSASTANAPMPQASGSNTQVSRPNVAQNSTSNSNSSVQLQRALNHARNMMRNSSTSGIYRRLSRSERLRSTSPLNSRGKTQEKQANRKKKKALEFALLKCFGDSSDEDLCEEYTLKWDSIIASGKFLEPKIL